MRISDWSSDVCSSDLLAIANALSHDIYYRMIDPHAPTKRRLIISRTLLVVVAILAAWVASTKPSTILAMVAWAFSIAASGLFPALVMGIRSEEHTSELQSLMRISYADFCSKT